LFDIINTLTEKDIKENFVAIGSYVDKDKVAAHSVIVIKYNGSIKHIHYDSKEILFDDIYNVCCFHKITDTINPALIPSFIVMCKIVMEKANPRYGYFYSGEYYDQNGIHFSEKAISETMTCSGFCLNILKGYLEEDYLSYKEWSTPTYPTKDYLERYANHFDLNLDDISESHRRISPLELLSSAYFSNLPITKSQVDSKVDETAEYLKNY
tara:strand:+ start:1636 stop:2268 length:633 start_codon:yes stop_codon:yes gene_type:complete